MCADTESKILEILKRVEREHNVSVLYACEAGSRVWGFSSEDSDYDVRFLYVHPRDWYTSINVERKRDVIELPLQDGLDISGWDIRKALGLFRKGNPPLMEWLMSPIKYCEFTSVAQKMRELMKEFYNPRAAAYHYLHMAQNNYWAYLKSYFKDENSVWVKKYFYALRPLLAVRWIEEYPGHPVPVLFDTLVGSMLQDWELIDDIRTLVKRKKEGKELGRGPRVESIQAFIEAELTRHTNQGISADIPDNDVEPLDAVFREAISNPYVNALWDCKHEGSSVG